MSPLDLLVALVRAGLASGEEGPAADVLEGFLRSHRLAPVRDGRNVWTEVGGEGPRSSSARHLDTVPVGEGWTKPPLEAHRERCRIYGRGANDAKASVAAMACASALRTAAPSTAAARRLAATCEEETGRPAGSPTPAAAPRPDAAVVGEPTGLAPVIAQKGLLVIEATAHGRPAHAARPRRARTRSSAPRRRSRPCAGSARARPRRARGPDVTSRTIEGGTRLEP